jgi:hypothetical protein
MLDIYFWLRFPLLLQHPAFVAAALEECRAAIQNTEVRLTTWKGRFEAASQNPDSTLEDLNECAEEFTKLAQWIEQETLRVLTRTLSYSYTIVKSTWAEVLKVESFDRLAGLYILLKTASGHCLQDMKKLGGEEREAMKRLWSLVEKALRCIKKRVEELFPEELPHLEERAVADRETDTSVKVQV